MAGSMMSESKINNLVACSRWGFGLHLTRPLDGLTIEEPIEFKAIEALPPFDENGNIAWTFEGEPTTSREKRWLELYRKQERAEQKGETQPLGEKYGRQIDAAHMGPARPCGAITENRETKPDTDA